MNNVQIAQFMHDILEKAGNDFAEAKVIGAKALRKDKHLFDLIGWSLLEMGLAVYLRATWTRETAQWRPKPDRTSEPEQRSLDTVPFEPPLPDLNGRTITEAVTALHAGLARAKWGPELMTRVGSKLLGDMTKLDLLRSGQRLQRMGRTVEANGNWFTAIAERLPTDTAKVAEHLTDEDIARERRLVEKKFRQALVEIAG